MAAGDTLAGDSCDSSIDVKSSDTVLEGLQMAADSLELPHTVDANRVVVDSEIHAALLTDMCLFVARSLFITISRSSKMKVAFAATNSQVTPGKDHASSSCCSCGGSFSNGSSSITHSFLDVWGRWKPTLSVSYGDQKLNAMNRPKLTCFSTKSSNSSSLCSSSCCCNRKCCSIVTKKDACGSCSIETRSGSCSIRWRSGDSRIPNSSKRSGSGNTGVWSFPEVVCSAVVVSLIMGVCSAACLGEVDCSSSQLRTNSQANVDYNTTSGNSSLSVPRSVDTGSHRRNHSHGILVSTQRFVFQNTVLTSQKFRNSAASKHGTRKVGQAAFLSADTPAPAAQESDEDVSKIISVAIPFACVILIAITLCVTWKLCRKYKCCNNEACLQKCSAVCDSCMAAPYTFQVPAHVKVQNQLSRDSTGLTLISQNRPGSVSHIQRSTGTIVRPPLNKLHVASHGASSTSLSRHSSSRSSRHNVPNTHGARQTAQSPKQTLGQVLGQPHKLAYASVHQNET